MKVIDLLNKIANGEEVPKKIKYKNEIYKVEYNSIYKQNYYKIEDEYSNRLLLGEIHSVTQLNEEVETIEEDKKIEMIKSLNNVWLCKDLIEFKEKQQLNNHILKDKINEIIDKLNKGDKE